MRADRLVGILMLLQVHGRMTAADLGGRFEVSERTIYRDMEALSAAGVPVFAERGSNGGWSLLEPYQTDLTGLNLSEIQTIFLANPAKLLADLGLRGAAEAAWGKLLAALPSTGRRDAAYMRQRIYIDSAGWHPSTESNPALPVLHEAVWEERRVQLIYQRGADDNVVERSADPLGLVAKGRAWYLVALVDGDVRTYRISRIQEAILLDEPCVRPPDFDLGAFWEQSTQAFVQNLPQYPVTLRVAPEALRKIRQGGYYTRVDEVGEAGADGWHIVHVRCQMLSEAIEYALSFGPQAEVIEPAELREQVIAAIAALRDLYGQGEGVTQR